MNVIQFPNPVKHEPGRSRKQQISQPEVPHRQLITNRVDFTCPSCRTASWMDICGVLLRHLDLYCMTCGVLHRLVNPAFSVGSGNGMKRPDPK